MIWGPYLDVLAKRPMALKYSGFFEGLSKQLRDFFSGLGLEGRKQVMGTLCQSSKEIGLEKALACLDDALRMNPKDADSLISTYAFVLNKPSPIPKNSVPGQICELSEYKLDLSVYAALMGGK